ncbi:CIC_collapsed_G0026150.mRNA.1.CDS.1 [Saccharomyces cerevisiae]|nr:CIC_collapsed_G0026150.mRNA.1.CDS.1 [Saccharomyces cerevisiae]
MGWGDLKGITSKLQYIKDLGVDAIWVCRFLTLLNKIWGMIYPTTKRSDHIRYQMRTV